MKTVSCTRKCLFKRWAREDEAVAAIEAGILFPLMLSILMGVVDLGVALTINEKVVNSGHMMADLLAREDDINDAEFTDIIVSGQLVIQPYDIAPFGYDIAGIQFVDEEAIPTVMWRETFNMDQNGDIESESEDLGIENEGVLAVTVHYTYTPFFTTFVVGEIEMEEVSYARGRKGLFVTRSAGS